MKTIPSILVLKTVYRNLGIRGFVYNDGTSYLDERRVINSITGPEFSIPGAVLVWPGEFIFGYPKQSSNNYRLPDPFSTEGDPVLKNGSYLIIRRLSQNVRAFYEETARISTELQQLQGFQKFNAEYVRAKMVGRFKNGVPLTKEDTRSTAVFDLFEDNNFLYKEGAQSAKLNIGTIVSGSKSDFMGIKCPMFAHIRKVNPRDLSTDQGSETDTSKFRVLRRGIPFGKPYDFINSDNPVNKEDRGLFFISYQTNIAQQFELLQNRWANTAINPEENKGFDMVIGHNNSAEDHNIWSIFENEQLEGKKVMSINKWVIPTGGDYFFCPSISLVQKIVALIHS
ncbi:MAG: Dyp-type peroxidase [Chitinophagaceae bacterium]|nr:Dyp-type peroxidase [Chitinophagaceae bacterium]